MEVFVNKVRSFHPIIFIKDIMSSFFSSCGLVLILAFFDIIKIETKIEVQQSVLVIFSFIVVFQIVHEISSGNRWFCESSEIYKRTLQASGFAHQSDFELKLNKQFVKISAVHEAGHVVMCYLKNIEINYVEVNQYSGRTAISETMLQGDSMKDYIMMLYSGAVAEELLLGSFNQGCMDGNGNDFNRALKLIQFYCIMENPEFSKTFLDDILKEKTIQMSKQIYEETKRVLMQKQDIISNLSSLIENKERMSKDELDEFMKKSNIV